MSPFSGVRRMPSEYEIVTQGQNWTLRPNRMAGLHATAGGLGHIEGFRVDWQWVPPWRPADITDSGREQLRAIGFDPR